ncbi:MAG: glycerol-3-phosphate acyltransferase [Candidatus Binatia bacterium]|nr:MAG: glycerol-3-phosphate acyltransferase [Candidatus Binatia bacterium]
MLRAKPSVSDSREPAVVFLLDARSPIERRLLRRWAEEQSRRSADTQVDYLELPSLRGKGTERLEARLAAGDDPLLQPVRVVWLHEREEGGERAATWKHVLFGDPRDPNWIRQLWILRRAPERCRIVLAEPARLSELRERWRLAGGYDHGLTGGLVEFVVRQATLALERAERRERGSRYKVPRLVPEEILGRPAFRGAVAQLARRLGRTEASVLREAARDLREIAAAHSPTMIDLATHLFRYLYRRGYRALRYDRTKVEEIARVLQRYPVAFLPTHRSNLDHPVLHVVLHECGLPPTHTAGGINMNFFPIGPVVRRAGVFFIRRSFKDDEVYKLVLRHYIDYLIEKRFSLEWYLEGGRSRSGKLLPPRFGLLAYVVDAYRRGKSEDVVLLPISIAYDQIQDVTEYVTEQKGGRKEPESFRWFLRMLRRLRRRYGDIHVRFGVPLSLAETIGPPEPGSPPNPDERSLVVQKIAFEVCRRMNEATPVTPVSLVTLALLGAGDRALTLEELGRSLRNVVDYVRRKNLPTTAQLDPDDVEALRAVLDALCENGVATCFAEGPEPVYAIGPEQQLAAAYYRNTVIHFFVTGAICELALLRAAETTGERLRAFFDEGLRLRDLFKFEFFFSDRQTFLEELRAEAALHDPDWQAVLELGPGEIHALVRRIRPFLAHRVLRPFADAYRVVADVLARLGPSDPVEPESLLPRCFALAKQYVLQRRVRSTESASKALFETGLRLARNRGLLEPGGEELRERRAAFAEEVLDVVRRIELMEALAAARRSGLVEV